MTGPDDSLAATRPISVAELLARNGTAGAPSAGGRRRLRRSNSNAVTVAELTGEIPIITDDTTEADVRSASSNGTVEPAVESEPSSPAPDSASETVEETAADTEAADTATETTTETETDAEAEYAAHIEARAAHPEPVDFQPRRRSRFSHVLRPSQKSQQTDKTPKTQAPTTPTDQKEAVSAPPPPAAGGAAEAMSPDPVVDEDEDVADSAVDLVEPTDVTLFGGASVDTDDSARRGIPGPEDIDLDEDADEDLEEETDEAPRSTMSALAHGAWIVGQSVIAVLFGAGLFIAFDQLWKWNVIVAMVLAVLVILGLVAGVRVVRKTEDIGTTLITIVVGALVTFGPLALQSV